MSASDAPRPVLVFVGPTLPSAEVRRRLPTAVVLPPVQCGDVLASLRLLPRAILIIDGVFERTPSVWHKEIAVALEQGTVVLGAASMGALRAAELDSLGMIGIGGIYSDFRAGRLVDDDEVAIIHTPDGRALSQAMVDIRATVDRARHEGRLSPALAGAVVGSAKALFYPERTLATALERLDEQPRERAELLRFARWVTDEGGWVDRKGNDARLALDELARLSLLETGTIERKKARVPRTLHLAALQRHVDCRPLHGLDPNLPQLEHVLQAARFLGADYFEVKQLARLLATLHASSSIVGGPATGSFEGAPAGSAISLWPTELDSSSWLDENDCSVAEREALRERVLTIERLVRRADSPPRDPAALLRWHLHGRVERYVRWLEVLGENGGQLSELRLLLARLWRALDRLAQDVGLLPQPLLLRRLLESVCRERRLVDSQSLTGWLVAHDLEPGELGALLLAYYRLTALSVGPQLIGLELEEAATHGSERLSIPRTEGPGVNWLLDAARLSGLYRRARNFLHMPHTERERVAILPRNLGEALARDFESDDPAVLRGELRALGMLRKDPVLAQPT